MKHPCRGGTCSSRIQSGAGSARPIIQTIAFLLSILFLLSLCACTGGDNQSEYHPASGESLEYVGSYTAFGMVHDDYRDYIVDLGEESSELTLSEDGTGVLTLSTESGEGQIEKWKVEGGLIDVTIGNRMMFGPVENSSIVQLYFEKETLTIYYAKEGADTSSYNVLSQEEFKEAVAAKTAE